MAQTKEAFLRQKLANFAAFARDRNLPEALAVALDSTKHYDIGTVVDFINMRIVPHREAIVEGDLKALKEVLNTFATFKIDVDSFDDYAAADVNRICQYLECFCDCVDIAPEAVVPRVKSANKR